MVRSVLLYTEITHLISYSYTSALLQQKRYDTSVFLLCCSKERGLTVLQWKRKKKSSPLMRVICPGYFKSKAPFKFSISAI